MKIVIGIDAPVLSRRYHELTAEWQGLRGGDGWDFTPEDVESVTKAKQFLDDYFEEGIDAHLAYDVVAIEEMGSHELDEFQYYLVANIADSCVNADSQRPWDSLVKCNECGHSQISQDNPAVP
ncbi:MAG: hypothetical protein KDA59_16150, partial [Planctomycetales bacterium]|nr:hypothetical protein [Planctomycetales bacterium]